MHARQLNGVTTFISCFKMTKSFIIRRGSPSCQQGIPLHPAPAADFMSCLSMTNV